MRVLDALGCGEVCHHPGTAWCATMALQVLGKGDKLVEPDAARAMGVLLQQMQVRPVCIVL